MASILRPGQLGISVTGSAKPMVWKQPPILLGTGLACSKSRNGSNSLAGAGRDGVDTQDEPEDDLAGP